MFDPLDFFVERVLDALEMEHGQRGRAVGFSRQRGVPRAAEAVVKKIHELGMFPVQTSVADVAGNAAVIGIPFDAVVSPHVEVRPLKKMPGPADLAERSVPVGIPEEDQEPTQLIEAVLRRSSISSQVVSPFRLFFCCGKFRRARCSISWRRDPRTQSRSAPYAGIANTNAASRRGRRVRGLFPDPVECSHGIAHTTSLAPGF